MEIRCQKRPICGGPKKLHEETEHPVTPEEEADQGPGTKGTVTDKPKEKEEDQALQEGLVELGRVSRNRASARENHGPRYVGGTAEEFTVDEVPQPPQPQADGGGQDGGVGQIPKGESTVPGKKHPGQKRPQQAPVKGHSPVPDSDDLEGVPQVVPEIGILVEKDVTEPGPHNQAHGEIGKEILERLSLKPQPPGPRLSGDKEVG